MNIVFEEWRDAGYRYPPEWNDMRQIEGMNYYRVTRENQRAMRQYGIIAEPGWYFCSPDEDGPFDGPFPTLAVARFQAGIQS